ncbi:LOW QUALITY PROTEIN: protein diaphanous homolog 2-like [Amphiura filiformis]|uniref:LOW QUALITY PROTEIN: protein diaphanous homolog 2-like n=1 Tax=Amphiura filiformis TaxID=82378 RepID=UPI003B21E8FF
MDGLGHLTVDAGASKKDQQKRSSKFFGRKSTTKPPKNNSKKPPSGHGPVRQPSTHGEEDDPQADYERDLQEKLTEPEVLAAFDRMLDDMGLTDAKARPLREKDMAAKRNMVIAYMKRTGSAASRNVSSTMKPGDYLLQLKHNYEQGDASAILATLSSLRVSLGSNPISWVRTFGEKGLEMLLRILSEFADRPGKKSVDIRHECIKCLRAFMNNKYGIQTVFDYGEGEALMTMATVVDHNHEHMMIDTVKLLAAVCLVPPDGHEKVLGALTEVAEIKSRPRFSPIVEALKQEENPQLLTVCMQLTNAIISTPEDLDFRLHLRNEFLRTGLHDILPLLYDNQSEELGVQMGVFSDHRYDDFDEFSHRFEGIKVEMDDIDSSFQVIKQVVTDTPAEPFFLSILQHCLLIREDVFIRPQYFKLIEECISQIVLHKEGTDPDFRHTSKFSIDVEPLVEGLAERAKYEEMAGKAEKYEKELEKELTSRQEADAKLTAVEKKIKEYEEKVVYLEEQVKNASTFAPVVAPPPAPNAVLLPSAAQGGPPPPPPPPPPPFGGGSGGPPPPPPPPPGPGGAPPPPPPPPPFGGGPGGPPPPPPPPGGPGAPPPPPGMFGALKNAFNPNALPHGMNAKKKYKPETQMKRANWSKINAKNLSKNAFWVKAQEEQLEDEEVLAQLANMFASKPAKKIGGGGGDKVDSAPKKKAKELKVLEGKDAQNLSIFFGSTNIPHDEVVRRIIEMDEEKLTDELISPLLKNLPEAETIQNVLKRKDEFDDMQESEQFCVKIGPIRKLIPRLQSMSFKLRFQEIVEEIRPQIVIGTKACEELLHTRKFGKVLEIILLFGNYMNSGSNKEQSLGFDLNYLTKLRNTKSVDNKTTFMNFLADTVEKRFPDVADFMEEIGHTKKALRVSEEHVTKNLAAMKKQVHALENDIKGFKPSADNDRFKEVMKDFVVIAREQYDTLEGMLSKMKSLYKEVGDYYTFDTKKRSFEEFFGDINTFVVEYEMSAKENKKKKEQEEKARKAKEEKEKAAKRKKIKKMNPIVDMTLDDDQEGVMDNLLEALQSGQAFSRPDKGRKRTPRPQGGNRQRNLERSRSRVGLKQPMMATSEIAIDEPDTSSRKNARSNASSQPNGMRTRSGADQVQKDTDDLIARLKAL